MYSPESLGATVLQPDGEAQPLVLPEHEMERLERLQELVGGHLEVVAIRGGRYMVGCETAKELPHVVNFELPNVAEDYVHRIGRTGRAGSEGSAVSLVCVDEHKLLKDIERLIKKPIDVIDCPAYAPDPSIRPEPIQMRSSGSRGGPRPSGNRAGNSSRSSAPRAPSSAAKPGGSSHRNGSRHR